MTVTSSLTPEPSSTPTPEPSPTHTPESSSKPEETAEPSPPLSDLIQNLDGTKEQEVLSIIAKQFPANKENNAYRFSCVGDEFITQTH